MVGNAMAAAFAGTLLSGSISAAPFIFFPVFVSVWHKSMEGMAHDH